MQVIFYILLNSQKPKNNIDIPKASHAARLYEASSALKHAKHDNNDMAITILPYFVLTVIF